MGSALATLEYVYIRKVRRMKCIFDKDMLKGKKLCWSLPEMKMKSNLHPSTSSFSAAGLKSYRTKIKTVASVSRLEADHPEPRECP